MKTDELWIIHYEDDTEFETKLDKATNLLSRYKIMRADAAQQLFTDCGIECGTPDSLVKDENRAVKEFIKIPFPIFSKKNTTYRTEVSESLFSDKNKGGPFSWKMSESKSFKEIYNINLNKFDKL